MAITFTQPHVDISAPVIDPFVHCLEDVVVWALMNTPLLHGGDKAL